MSKLLSAITDSIEKNIRDSLYRSKNPKMDEEVKDLVEDELERMGVFLVGLYRNKDDNAPPPPPKSLLDLKK